MKYIWNTLAMSAAGTHKMRFADAMELAEAVELGKRECKENRLEYKGTYGSEDINEEEKKLQEIN